MESMHSQRSYLFVPGDRPDRFDKAIASGADAIVVDLEDAVIPAQKNAARAIVARWLDSAKSVVLRINAAGTTWFRDDLELCRHPSVEAVMLAKAEQPADVEAVGAIAPTIALIESAVGFDNLRAIASCTNLQRLAFGSIDLQLDLNLRSSFDELIYFRSRLVLASRVANLAPPIDSPSTSIDDLTEVESEARRARRLGFGAKLCIHPSQIAGINASFSPSPDELEWAARVIKGARASDGAAFALDGRMVDKPVISRAEAMLRESSQ